MELLLLTHAQEKDKFQKFYETRLNHPHWDKVYPWELYVTAIVTTLITCFFYIFPWTFEFSSMHGDDVVQNWLQLTGMLGVFLLLWFVLSSIKVHRERAHDKQASLIPPGQSLPKKNDTLHLYSIRWVLYCYGLSGAIFALVLIGEDIFILHQFQSVLIGLATLLFFVAFWPCIRISSLFIMGNAQCLYRKCRKTQIITIALAGPPRELLPDAPANGANTDNTPDSGA